MTPLAALVASVLAQLGEQALRGPIADLLEALRALVEGDAVLAERLDAAILRAQSRNRAAEVAAELDAKIRRLEGADAAHAPTDPPPATERSPE